MAKLPVETIAKESVERIQRMLDDEYRVRGKKTVAELGDEDLSWRMFNDVVKEEINVQFVTHDFDNDDDATEFLYQIYKAYFKLTELELRQMAVEAVADAKQHAINLRKGKK